MPPPKDLGKYAEFCRKISESNLGERNPHYGKPRPESTRNKISASLMGHPSTCICHTEETKLKISKSHIGKGHPQSIETRIKISNSESGENHYNWKGGISREPYCKLWSPNLRRRIRARWGNRSVWSGKTKEENGNQELACHHVYYQKKACCEWDEDYGGYYAIIDGEKYYIKGDPNKFVTLTRAENAMVNYNRLYWAQKFEDLVLDHGDKSYLTQEEML